MALAKSDHPRILNVSSRLGVSLHKMANKDFRKAISHIHIELLKLPQNMRTLCLQQEFENKGISVTGHSSWKIKD